MLKATLILLSCFVLQPKPLPKNVYVCSSSQSYAYHYYKNCKALESCSSNVKTLTRAWVVKDKKRKLCSICKNTKIS